MNMKTRLFSISLISALLIGSIFILLGCSKDDGGENLPPTITITSPANMATFPDNTNVTITADAQDVDGKVAQVMFYVDDVYASSANNPPYKYTWNTSGASKGDHIIKAKASDDNGGIAFTTVTLRIITGPEAAFTADRTNIFQDEAVIFTDQSTGTPANWAWSFGDGGTSNDQSPTHTYTTAGTFTVSLTVSNTEGSNTETKIDYITVLNNTFTDARDNQVYKLVEIGTQIWMAENLNYDDGAANCFEYDNSAANGQVYGRLYTWNSALTSCPAGWHLSTNDDWDTLVNYLGGELVAGGKMKETGTSHWTAPNADATNESGFTALAAGYKDMSTGFQNLKGRAYFWTSKDISSFYSATSKKIYHDTPSVISADVEYENGLSVRCVKD